MSDASPLVEQGQAALRRAEWDEAVRLFEQAAEAGPSAEVYEFLAWAYWWTNDLDRTVKAREEAFKRYQAASETQLAARNAVWLSSDYMERGEVAVANGWRQRAHRLLDGRSTTPEHGWLAMIEADIALLMEDDTVRSRELAAAAIQIGRQTASPDLEVLGLAIEGLALVCEGQVEEGMKRLDEAGTTALAGDMHQAFTPSLTLCYLIYACERVRDYDRAAEWCERMRVHAEALNAAFAQAVCRAHYAGVLLLKGKWREAEAQLTEVRRLSEAQRPPVSAEGMVRLAELRRRQGRIGEARELFEQNDWHPLAVIGLAELALETGAPLDAREHGERLLRQTPETNRTQRLAALELLVRAASVLGDFERAGEALAEIRALTELAGTMTIRAGYHFAAAALAMAQDAADEARAHLEDARDLFEMSAAPYESARTRLELARVLVSLGREERGRHEAARSLAISKSLGASAQSAAASALIEEIDRKKAARSATFHGLLTPRQVEVLRLISEGLSDREIAARLVVSEHTVHRHVANILERFNVRSRASAVAYAASRGLI